jgi:hypothetical protein
MRITGTGFVGINNAAPTVALDVVGQTEFITNAISTGYASIIENNTIGAVSSGALRLINSGTRTVGNHGATVQNLVTKSGGSNSTKTGLEIISTGAWGTGGSGGHFNRALYVESSGGVDGDYAAVFMGGNVGIGYTNPTSKLSVFGNFDAGGSNSVTGSLAGGIGYQNVVSGTYASAIGFTNSVAGAVSFAAGSSNTVAGNRASAYGTNCNIAFLGSMGFGDYSTLAANTLSATANNQYNARFDGGYRFFTDANMTPSLDVFFSGSGNVGIGVSAPTSQLHVEKNTSGVLANFDNNSVSGGTGLQAVVTTSATGAGTRYGLYSLSWYGQGVNYGTYSYAFGGSSTYGVFGLGSGGTTNYAGYFSGNLNYTGLLTNVSDRKFKRNIEPLTGAIDKILLLNPKTYFFKTDEYSHMNMPGGKQFGLIAQEVAEVFPELVVDGVHPAQEDENGKVVSEEVKFKSMNYSGLTPIIIQAIKEQQQQIEELKKLIAAQQKLIEELNKK